MTVLVGTSGWQYADWRGAFYPAGLPPPGWLGYYARRFQTVEINTTFYRLPSAQTFARWAAVTPDDFVVVAKASRYLTHVKRLADPDEPVRRFLEHARPLGEKLRVVLVQLPPTMPVDVERLRRALDAFPDRVRVAVEFRHPSWFVDDVRRALADRGAALCLADRGSRLLTPVWRTADWTLLRLHAGRGSPRPCYGHTALRSRARLLADGWGATAEVFAFLNNDTHACAPRDARRLALACRRQGLPVGRVPPPGQVRLSAGARPAPAPATATATAG